MVVESAQGRARPSGARFSKSKLVVPVALSLVLALFGLVACKPPEPRSGTSNTQDSTAAAIQMRTVGQVSTSGFALEVDVTGAAASLRGAEARVFGEMSHPGMPRLTWPAIEVEPGLYRVENLVPDMAGDWILTAELQPADGAKVTTELFLTVPR